MSDLSLPGLFDFESGIPRNHKVPNWASMPATIRPPESDRGWWCTPLKHYHTATSAEETLRGLQMRNFCWSKPHPVTQPRSFHCPPHTFKVVLPALEWTLQLSGPLRASRCRDLCITVPQLPASSLACSRVSTDVEETAA